MSADLVIKIHLGLEQLASIREQLSPLIAKAGDADVGTIEVAAACAMLHSFYAELVDVLSEFLAFRHLFRGASIVLMRWDKLFPLVGKVDKTHSLVKQEIENFCVLLEPRD